MKISFFIGSLGSGGAEKIVAELANYLSNNNEVTVVTWSNKIPHYSLSNQVNFNPLRTYTGKSVIRRNINSYCELITYVKEQKVDCYIVFLSISTFILLSLRKIISCPIIFSVRTYPPKEYGGIVRGMLSRLLLRYADGVVYQTKEQSEFFPYLKINMAIIPNPVYVLDPESINDHSGGEEKRILAVGRLSSEKNYPFMVEVMTRVLRDFPEYRLDVFGEGPLRRTIEKKIAASGMSEQIHLCGVSRDILFQLQTADIFLLLSEYEGISNALLEAMATGVAVIATDCLGGGNRMLIENGKNGILIPRGNAEQLEIAVRKLLVDKTLRYRIASNAKYVRVKYSPEKIYLAWEQFIEYVTKSNKGMGEKKHFKRFYFE